MKKVLPRFRFRLRSSSDPGNRNRTSTYPQNIAMKREREKRYRSSRRQKNRRRFPPASGGVGGEGESRYPCRPRGCTRAPLPILRLRIHPWPQLLSFPASGGSVRRIDGAQGLVGSAAMWMRAISVTPRCSLSLVAPSSTATSSCIDLLDQTNASSVSHRRRRRPPRQLLLLQSI